MADLLKKIKAKNLNPVRGNRPPAETLRQPEDKRFASEKENLELAAAAEAYLIFQHFHDNPDFARKKIVDFLQESGSYLDKKNEASPFEFSLTEPEKGFNYWKDLSPKAQNLFKAMKSQRDAEAFLKTRLDRNGLSLDEFVERLQIDKETRRVTRIDFNGCVNLPEDFNLSAEYAAISTKTDLKDEKQLAQDGEICNDELINGRLAQIYDLDKCPAWQKFAKFESFRKKENLIRRAMYACEIDNRQLENLNVFDIEHMLCRYHDFQMKKPEYSRGRFSYQEGLPQSVKIFDNSRNPYDHDLPFDGAKAFAVKNFINNHEEEFVAYLKEMGVSEKTEINPRTGKEESDISRAVATMKRGNLPKVQRPEGRYLEGTVHHEVAIQDAGYLDDVTQVNHWSNMRIIFDVKKGNLKNLRNVRSQEVALAKEYDFKSLTENPEKASQTIKDIFSKQNYFIRKMLKFDMNLDEERVDKIMDSAKEGKLPRFDLDETQYLRFSIKKVGDEYRLAAQPVKKEAGMVHNRIFHGIMNRKKSTTGNLLQRVMTKYKENLKPYCILGSMKKIIYQNDKDLSAKRDYGKNREQGSAYREKFSRRA